MSDRIMIPDSLLNQIAEPFFCVSAQKQMLASNRKFRGLFGATLNLNWHQVIGRILDNWLDNQQTRYFVANVQDKHGRSRKCAVKSWTESCPDKVWFFRVEVEPVPSEVRPTLPKSLEVMANAIDGYAFIDVEGYYQKVSDGFANMLGYESNELIGQHYEVTKLEEFSVDDHLLLKELQTKDVVGPKDQYLRHRQNDAVPVSIYLSVTRGVAAQITGYWVLVRSLVRLKELEKSADVLEARYKYLFENSLDGIARADVETGFITNCNDAFCILTGYGSEELTSLKISNLSTKEWMQQKYPEVEEEIKSFGYTGLYEKEIVNQNGDLVPVTLRNFAEYDQDNNVVAIWALTRDNRENLQLIQQLRESEEKYRSIFECSLDAIGFFTIEGECVEFNDAYPKMLGYEADEIRQINYYDHIYGDRKDIEPLILEQLARQGYTEVIEKELIHKDGHRVPVSLRASAMKNPDGEVIGAWMLVRDISQSRAVLNNLKHSQQILEQTGRLARVGGWEYDTESQRVILTKEVYRILGLSNQFSPTIENALDMFSDDSKQEIRASVEVALMLATPFDVEVEFLGFKTSRWLRLTGQVRQDPGGRQYIVGALQDVTEYKNIQRQLSDNQNQLQYLAFHDSLTGLPNQTLVLDRLEHAFHRIARRRGSLSILLINVNELHKITDIYGHSIGDEYFKTLSDRLIKLKRLEDTLGRCNQNQLILLAENCNKHDADILAGKIINQMQIPVAVPGYNIQTTVQIAKLVFPEDQVEPSDVFDMADRMITEGKRRGANQVVNVEDVL